MIVQRGYTYRLYPTSIQKQSFAQWSGVCRAVYNAALFQRRHFGRKGRYFSFASQCRELTDLRNEFDWIKIVSQTAEQQALKDLDQAHKNFFAGRAGYPTPRRKHTNESFRINGRECSWRKLHRHSALVKLPKIGEVRFRLTRPLPNQKPGCDENGSPFGPDIRSVTISRTALGWQVSFACRFEIEDRSRRNKAVGIDRGVANSIALSTGDLDSIPLEQIRLLDRRHRKHQQAMARRKRGSARYAKARQRAAAVKAKAARIRRQWNHEKTKAIAGRFGTVCIEDLKIVNMTASAKGTIDKPGRNVRQKAGLNRSILEQGWYQFETFLAYKIEAQGGQIIKVNPVNTSRECRKCHCISHRNRESQALFRCIACGHEEHADVHAAKTILRAGTRPSGHKTIPKISRHTFRREKISSL